MASSDQISSKPSLSETSRKYILENEESWGNIICRPKGANTYKTGLEEVLKWPDFLKDDFRVWLCAKRKVMYTLFENNFKPTCSVFGASIC
jgi:hypothetical protein